ncbi:MAG: hypothetical protein ABIA74_00690 [bacterium]
MEKIFKILICILSINLFANAETSHIPLSETIKSQIEISSNDLLSFFEKETEYILRTQRMSEEQISEITKQISDEIQTKFPTYRTALSLMYFINDTVAPSFKKITGISLTVNKVKMEKNQFILVLDCEIQKQQFLKWSTYKLTSGLLFAGKQVFVAVFDSAKPLIQMYIWTYYIYPRIYKYMLNNPNLVIKYLWLKTLYNLYSEPVETARYVLSWVPLISKLWWK